MRTPSYDIAALEAELGQRGPTIITTANRAKAQNWCCAKGMPSAKAKSLTVRALDRCYNGGKFRNGTDNYVNAVIRHALEHGADATMADDDDGAADTATAAVIPPAVYEAPPPASAAVMVPAVVAPSGDTAAQLAALIQTLAAGAINEARVVELIREHAPKPRQHEIVITVPETGERRNIGTQHHNFEKLLRACAARDKDGNRLNVMLVGPAGSGKTTAADNVAKALGLKFAFNGAIDSEYKLLGFVDAQGRIVSRPFRDIYENGGIYLFDECDASLPPALLALNAATANGYCDFPDGAVPRHPDCVILAAANTFGHGATDQYTGRAKLDISFLDRFPPLQWPIDETLESATCPNPAWCEYVQAVRRRVAEHGIPRALVTPRASYQGAALLAAGIDRETVIAMTLRRAMSDDQWQAVA